MAAIKLIIQQQKGGVGKTFLVKHYATSKARKYPHKRFLLIGLDPQNELAKEFLSEKDYNDIYNQKDVDDKVEKSRTLYNTLINKKDLSISQTKIPNLDIVPNTILLADADIQMANALDHKEERLSNAVEKIVHLYDEIIFDGLPSLGMIALNGLRAAKYLIIIIEPGEYSLQAVEQLDNTITQIIIGTFKHNIQTLGIVLNKYLDRDKVSKASIEELNDAFGNSNIIFNTMIPRRNIVGKTEGKGITTFDYDPASDINIALLAFLNEVEQRINLLKLAENGKS